MRRKSIRITRLSSEREEKEGSKSSGVARDEKDGEFKKGRFEIVRKTLFLWIVHTFTPHTPNPVGGTPPRKFSLSIGNRIFPFRCARRNFNEKIARDMSAENEKKICSLKCKAICSKFASLFVKIN